MYGRVGLWGRTARGMVGLSIPYIGLPYPNKAGIPYMEQDGAGYGRPEHTIYRSIIPYIW